VREFEPARANITALLHGSVTSEGFDEKLAAQWIWIESPGNPIIELVAPTDDGPVASWIEKRGEGLHHLSFMPDSLDASLGHARDCGLHVIGEDRAHSGYEEFMVTPADTGNALFHSFRALGG
jgi:methylmalonyl-CoA/ethylmalonyl-CoA epimerase